MIFPLFRRKLTRGVKEHVAAGLQPAADYVAVFENVYAPFSGKVYHFNEPKGGTWLGITRDNGDRVEFAHLLKRVIKPGKMVNEGDLVAVSGNTGTETTGPHLHVQVLDKKSGRYDPEQYFIPKSLPVHNIGASIQFMQQVQAEILKYSAGMLTISWDFPPITQPVNPTQDEVYPIINNFIELDIHAPAYRPLRYWFLFCTGQNALIKTYYGPAHNYVVSVISSNGLIPRSVAFEFGHQVQLFYNENRGTLAPVQVEDSNFPDDDMLIRKYRSVLPHFDILNKI